MSPEAGRDILERKNQPNLKEFLHRHLGGNNLFNKLLRISFSLRQSEPNQQYIIIN